MKPVDKKKISRLCTEWRIDRTLFTICIEEAHVRLPQGARSLRVADLRRIRRVERLSLALGIEPSVAILLLARLEHIDRLEREIQRLKALIHPL